MTTTAGTLSGQAFMIPSYAFIAAAILNSNDMATFLTLSAASAVCTVAGGIVGIQWAQSKIHPKQEKP